MKNWKTTLTGVIGAIVLCVVQAISTGNVDPKTLIIAAVIAGIGAFAQDGDVKAEIAANPILQTALPMASTILDDVSKTSTNPLIKDIHTMVSGLVANQTAPVTTTTTTEVNSPATV